MNTQKSKAPNKDKSGDGTKKRVPKAKSHGSTPGINLTGVTPLLQKASISTKKISGPATTVTNQKVPTPPKNVDKAPTPTKSTDPTAKITTPIETPSQARIPEPEENQLNLDLEAMIRRSQALYDLAKLDDQPEETFATPERVIDRMV